MNKTYPNQRVVTIKKNKHRTYASYGTEEIAYACKNLKPSGFRVWLYLMSNKADVNWYISPAHARDMWGIPLSSFHDGIKELKEKGYYDEVMKEIYMTPYNKQVSVKKLSNKEKKEKERRNINYDTEEYETRKDIRNWKLDNTKYEKEEFVF